MRVASLRNKFEQLLPRDALTPAVGIDAMLRFYERKRVFRCPVAKDGDMLLYQWGTYDWGQGEHFEIDITRQVIPSSIWCDPGIHQLSLTFRFQPSQQLRTIARGERWCSAPDALPDFCEFILSSAAYQGVGNRLDSEVDLDLESVE